MIVRDSIGRTTGLWIALILGLLLGLCGASFAQTGGGGTPEKPGEQFVSIDFNNVDIGLFIKFMSELTGTNFVVDNAVKGKVTIISPARISLDEAYRVFESVLDVYGFSAVKAGDVVKIVPSPAARSMNIQTLLEMEKAHPEDRVVTQLIPLKYADPEEIKRLFTPLVSKASVILGYAPANTLIITDVQSNIQRLMKILKQIDQPGTGQQISVIPLQHADAAKLVTLLSNLFKTTAPRPQQATVERPPVIVADERTSTVVMLASEVDTLRIKQLIAMIDKETPRGKGKIHVYTCEHANAEDLAKVLQEIPSQQAGAGSVGGAGGAAATTTTRGPTAVVMGKVQINADKATNSLIIMADKEDYEVVEGVIKKLDIPRSMVYIESLIMEVNATKSFDLGVQWQLFDQTNVNNQGVAYGGKFSTAPGLLNPLTALGSGLALGVLTEPFTFGGLTLSNVSAIINAVKRDDNFKILSTPQILTTDNEEARITVGENRPFQTRATTDVSGGTFESFEYKDVGKILKITPHVSEGRNVRMKLSLEVTSLDRLATATTGTAATRPVTQKRTIDTTVLVKDNHTVVIGGLIDDNRNENETKVPGLGDIPILGWLFKTQGNANQKTNLYVFITPRVVKSPEEADKLLSDKKLKDVVPPAPFEGGDIKLYREDLN
ncbi:MAG: type II secretion system secretin GspD [Desulfobacterales bacterium]|nr:type II secretion system secretin GspD [Desulfobacterales bacterium]